jgi:hypothetical protein
MSSETSRWAKTDAALNRIDQAIARLEAMMTVPEPKMPDLFGNDDLGRARKDYAKLDQASRQVEARLDDMATRLQALLES